MGMHEDLVRLSEVAAGFSYSPYSRFKVGAAGLFENPAGNQKIFTGCNIENAAYGPTNCGERTAVFSAVAEGYLRLIKMCVFTPTETASSPCGVCRQVMNEFGPDAEVVCTCNNPDAIILTTVAKLLPNAFGPKNLGK
ncbi:MAG: cytidine deaminase [Candidatus Woesebacteria bacterium]